MGLFSPFFCLHYFEHSPMVGESGGFLSGKIADLDLEVKSVIGCGYCDFMFRF